MGDSYITITKSVGSGAMNDPTDVIAIQIMLNHFSRNGWLEGTRKLDINGRFNQKTAAAIATFQMLYAHDEFTSGKMLPKGTSIRFMNAHAGNGPPKGKPSTSEWSRYTKSGFAKKGYLSAAAKKWLAQPPAHDREAAMFKTSKTDGGRPLIFLAWKSQGIRHCLLHSQSQDDPFGNEGMLHGWLERETSLAASKRNHKLKTDWISVLGNDAGGKGISAMNRAMNIFMLHYVMVNGKCAESARVKARRDVANEAKGQLSLFISVVGGASGAKGSGVKPIRTQENALLRLSKVNWKGWIKQMKKLKDGKYGKSAGPKSTSGRLAFNESIHGPSGEVVGVVRYFD